MARNVESCIKLYISSYTISDTAKTLNLTEYFLSNAHNWFPDTYRLEDSGVYLVAYFPIIEEFLLIVKLAKLFPVA